MPARIIKYDIVNHYAVETQPDDITVVGSDTGQWYKVSDVVATLVGIASAFNDTNLSNKIKDYFGQDVFKTHPASNIQFAPQLAPAFNPFFR